MTPISKCILVFLMGLALGVAPAPVAATYEKVDLELALGVDVSGSIDEEEALLQREGYIQAFRHPSVIRAIMGGYHRRIAVGYFEWAGYGHNKVVVDWFLIDSKRAAYEFAGELTKIPPETASRTSLSGAISFATPWFDENFYLGRRKVIDLSGDGPNNWGDLVTLVRDRAVDEGVTINGLPIMNMRPSPYGTPQLESLDLYFRYCVIGGRSSFIEIAKSFKDFGRAIRRKLVLEISGRMPKQRLANVNPSALRHHHQSPRLSLAKLTAPRLSLGKSGVSLAQFQPSFQGSGKRRIPPCNIGEVIWKYRDTEDF